MQEIIKAVQDIAIKISEVLKYGDLGYATSSNATGDTQLKLDILSDEIIENRLKELSSIKAIISEEKDAPLSVNDGGEYIIAYDPLDGSSLVDVNFAVGSIFGVYKGSLEARNLVVALYSVYGPRVELVVCDDSVKLFRLNRDNEFKFIKNLELNQKGKINATGGTQKGWSDSHRAMIKSLFDDGYRLRYSGAMVSDLHQVLLKGGGLFSYPATTDAPNGKLRVAFEVLPFAYIYEKAGGATTNGVNDSLLDIKIEQTHQTTPCYFGSKFEIDRVKNG
ncbi:MULTISPECIES: class 1 fructose-bisphosphatase [Campylobacter]|uniref:Fructose-1,6-bisphosphatase class 1 n=1 Tax=Campylobacter porcelli TaxID=1660073 RepID=A0A1X9SX15_9BACT|nr:MULTISPECIES: class 1 fructose-bisphosphatase [unclassified Campylobacter]ARR00818.1 fructose-1,6-bisphosphatase I [Campylobacter sp. RM6137]MCR8678291.1 class 1 fructose-bisphosphatase [Campylobacter sp. RM19072]